MAGLCNDEQSILFSVKIDMTKLTRIIHRFVRKVSTKNNAKNGVFNSENKSEVLASSDARRSNNLTYYSV